MDFETNRTKGKLDRITNELEHGPVERRSCTDKIFCALFLILLMYGGNYSYSAYKMRTMNRLFMPVDHYGKKTLD